MKIERRNASPKPLPKLKDIGFGVPFFMGGYPDSIYIKVDLPSVYRVEIGTDHTVDSRSSDAILIDLSSGRMCWTQDTCEVVLFEATLKQE